ncbi:chromate efflux transporter [Rheinheimera sp.]|uniref:chromate efflux transporter n=1 Tax=Rheinheimera sp. TaxID=1869214 RepID=UPI002736E126|nr:chromate efflux transporter [Rheinheimera sp.]MDP2713358.1 chromate efflux transporter [Rheinheimera sp.]
MTTSSVSVPLWQLFIIFFRLGCSSFGGPVAHLGYFHHEFVEKRRWYSAQSYAELVALCQFLPGPASSQVGIAIGLNAAGYRGALLSWLGFTLPSAALMLGFAVVYLTFAQSADQLWLSGLKIVALAVVAQAVWGMGKSLCPDPARAGIALLSAVLVLLLSGVVAQIAVMLVAALVGILLLPQQPATPRQATQKANTRASWWCLLLFFVLLAGLPVAAQFYRNEWLSLFDSFYRAGALVFGGGHVVLPLLQSELVPHGWLSDEAFLAGYGAAQAVPGPLFSLATYLGAVSAGSVAAGAILATVAIFLPAFLLLFAALPWWQRLSYYPAMRRAMAAVNAAVVGLLLAALYDPVFISAIHGPVELVFALLAFLALMYWKFPPYIVVFLAVIISFTITRFS